MADALETLSELADRQWEAMQRVGRAEAVLKFAKQELVNISENLIPELMDTHNTLLHKTTTGLTVEVVTKMRAHISKERAPEAFKWLRDNGHGKLIKNVFVAVPKDGLTAGQVEDALQDISGLEYETVFKVHPATLTAFVNKQLEDGEDVDMKLLGVFRQRVAKVTHA